METKIERETKEIITPIDNHKVIIKTYITGREDKMIKRIWRSLEITMKQQDGKDGMIQTSKSFNVADRTEDAERKVVELIVVSVDGKTENVVDLILDMNKKDSIFVEKEIDEITGDDDKDKKKA